ncbi:unnamed protein product [Rangifer tarandus platyrhynchus]|uniref:Uncharacterized protein n=1 Tax=Rangifer tarandus platyrhynchus TaxID=3082113 RepID=A0ABN8Z264_RANTA|nr:unnamed protein product [Rangifer tarandus platyrhynchus]
MGTTPPTSRTKHQLWDPQDPGLKTSGPGSASQCISISPKTPWALALPTSKQIADLGLLQPCTLPYQDPAHLPGGLHLPQDPLGPSLPSSSLKPALGRRGTRSQLIQDTAPPTSRTLPALGLLGPCSQSPGNPVLPISELALALARSPCKTPPVPGSPNPPHQQAGTNSKTPCNP